MSSYFKKLLLIPLFLSMFTLAACDISSDGITVNPDDSDNGNNNDDDNNSDGDSNGSPDIDDDNDDESLVTITTNEFDLDMSYGHLSDSDFDNFISIDGVYNNATWDTTNIDYSNSGVYDILVNVDNIVSKVVSLNLFDDINIPTLTNYDIENDVTGTPINEDEIDTHIQVSTNNTGVVSKSWILASVDFDTIGTYPVDVTLYYGNGLTTIETVNIHILDYSIPTILTSRFNYNMSDPMLTSNDVNNYISIGGNSLIVDSISWDLTNINYTSAGEYDIDVTVIYNTNLQLHSTVVIKLFDDVNVPSVDTTKILRDIADGVMFDYDMHSHVNITNNNTGLTDLKWNLSNVNFYNAGTYYIQVTITYGNNIAYSESIEIEIYQDNPPVINNIQINYTAGDDFNTFDWVTNLHITDDNTLSQDLIIDISELSKINHNIQYKTTQFFRINITDTYGNITSRTIYLDFQSMGLTPDQIYDELYKSSVKIGLTKTGRVIGSGTIIDYEKQNNSMIISTNSHVTEGSTMNTVEIYHSDQKPAGNYLPNMCAEIMVEYPGGVGRPDVAILEVVGEMTGSDCSTYSPIDLSLYENDFRVLELIKEDDYMSNTIDDYNRDQTKYYTMGYPLDVLGFGEYTYYYHWDNLTSSSGFTYDRMELYGYSNESGASGSLIVDQNLNLVAIYTGRSAGVDGRGITALYTSIKESYLDFCNLDPAYMSKIMCQNL